MCTAMLQKSMGLEAKLMDKTSPSDWAARKMGYAGSGLNFDRDLKAKFAGQETRTDIRARKMGEATGTAEREAAYNRSQAGKGPAHALNIAARKARGS